MPTVFEQTDRAVNGSVAIANSASDDESTTNERALMIENMELVEPKKTVHVPNHLLESSKVISYFYGCKLSFAAVTQLDLDSHLYL